MFTIRMGVPEMEEFWDGLLKKRKENTLSKTEIELFNRFAKAILFLSSKHPGLKTHEIIPLSEKYGFKIWQSYLDQGVTARRFYWTYGPNKAEITILGIEPHPEDKKNGSYKRIKLSDIPKT
jgi:hypothetical protein